MAYVVMTYLVMTYLVMAYRVMAYLVMVYLVMVYLVMVYLVMAYIVMPGGKATVEQFLEVVKLVSLAQLADSDVKQLQQLFARFAHEDSVLNQDEYDCMRAIQIHLQQMANGFEGVNLRERKI